MTQQDFGRATQARFVMDAQLHGLLVSCPFDSAPGYDAVVDNGHRLLRVQVKGARLTTDGTRAGRYVFKFSPRQGHSFDILAAWLDAEADWLLIPRSRCPRSSNITISGRSPLRRCLSDWAIFRRNHTS
jgi:hypothetical protein